MALIDTDRPAAPATPPAAATDTATAPASPANWPWSRRRRAWIAGIAMLATAPTLASLGRAGFVADDWTFLRAAQRDGAAFWLHGVDARFRPVQALVHGLMFGLIGDHPALHLLVLAALEAALVVVGALLLRRFLPWRATVAVLVVWSLLPNRSAPRLWAAAAPVSVAVLALLGAALAATGERRRPVVATVLACVAVLTYEAGVLLGLAAVLMATVPTAPATMGPGPATGRHDRWLPAGRALAVYAAVVVWNLSTSPKSSYGYGPLRSAVDAVAGSALAPRPLGVAALGLVALAVVGIAVSPPARAGAARGAAVAALALTPLLAVGANPTGDGPFDRLNVMAVAGVAVMLGVGLDAALGRGPRRLAVARFAPVALVAVLAGGAAWALALDVGDVTAARADADATIAAARRLPADLATERLVLEPGAGHHGWFAFGWESARSAVELRTGRSIHLRDPQPWQTRRAPGERRVRLVGDRLVVDPGDG